MDGAFLYFRLFPGVSLDFRDIEQFIGLEDSQFPHALDAYTEQWLADHPGELERLEEARDDAFFHGVLRRSGGSKSYKERIKRQVANKRAARLVKGFPAQNLRRKRIDESLQGAPLFVRVGMAIGWLRRWDCFPECTPIGNVRGYPVGERVWFYHVEDEGALPAILGALDEWKRRDIRGYELNPCFAFVAAECIGEAEATKILWKISKLRAGDPQVDYPIGANSIGSDAIKIATEVGEIHAALHALPNLAEQTLKADAMNCNVENQASGKPPCRTDEAQSNRGSDYGGRPKGRKWQDVAKEMAEDYSSLFRDGHLVARQELAKRFGCSPSTVQKAIQNDPILKTLGTRNVGYGPLEMGAFNSDSEAVGREHDPSDFIPPDELDVELHRLIEEAPDEESRAALHEAFSKLKSPDEKANFILTASQFVSNDA
jgi:hypothetical protein